MWNFKGILLNFANIESIAYDASQGDATNGLQLSCKKYNNIIIDSSSFLYFMTYKITTTDILEFKHPAKNNCVEGNNPLRESVK